MEEEYYSMKRMHLSALLVPLAFWLAASVPHAQGIESAYFQALNLIRFSPPLELPEVTLLDMKGETISLHSFHGKVILLNFWTTW
jgi:cytochrome oxidase Cu insertion factor (SCO1/SenC/PrrC family)